MSPDHWRNVMHEAVKAVHTRLQTGKNCGPTAITDIESLRLHKSINAMIDHEGAKDDTIFRTDGKCPIRPIVSTYEFVGLAGAFNRLNKGLDGG